MSTLIFFKNIEIIELEIEPMMWGYMQNVETYFDDDLFKKYGRLFEKIWIASAYKGASGELAKITSIEHRYRNHISWMKVMKDKVTRNILKFKGIALTGWSRYDHFLSLCDLLPQAIPSLVFNLKAMQVGELTEKMRDEITKQLGCNGPITWDGANINENINCDFPGHEVYEAILPIESIIDSTSKTMEFAEKYVSPISLENSYLHVKRTQEVMDRLIEQFDQLIAFKNNFLKAAETIYYEDTGNEWLRVYFIHHLDKIYDMIVRIKNGSHKNSWEPRPLQIKLRNYTLNYY